MRTAGMEEVRNALKAFSANGNTTTVAQMRDALGAETESQRQMVRRLIQELIERGEVERVGQGHFRYIPGRERRHPDDGLPLLAFPVHPRARASSPRRELHPHVAHHQDTAARVDKIFRRLHRTGGWDGRAAVRQFP